MREFIRMRLHHPTLTLAIMLAAARIATAAPPAIRGLPAIPALAQASAANPTPPEELPVRARPGKDANPLRGAVPPVPEAGGRESTATGASATKETADAKGAKEQGGADATTKGQGCGKPDCAVCSCLVPTCKPKWEDKKTKKATFTMTCDFECVRPWEPYHQGDCCEEKTTPCGDVRTKKKLFKTEEEKVERVLKYEVAMRPAAPCCEPEPACCCLGCRCLGATFQRLFHRHR